MPLKAQIKGEVPEDLKDYYKPAEGKDGLFVLDVEPVDGFSLEDVSGLKTALGKERTEREKLEKAVVKYKDLDPDKAREALAKLEEFESIDPDKEADKIANTKFEAAKKQLLEKHNNELSERQKRIGSLESLVDKLARKQEAIAAIAEQRGSVELLLPHVLNSTKSEVTDDGVRVRVLQEDGSDRVNGKGEPMSIRELVADMKASETFSRAFDGSGATGSGGGAGNGSGNGTAALGNKKAAEMGLAEKTAFIGKHGIDAWTKKLNDEVKPAKQAS